MYVLHDFIYLPLTAYLDKFVIKIQKLFKFCCIITFDFFSLDLRSTVGEDECVSVKEAKKMALDLNFVQYMEVSSLLNKGVDDLFKAAVSYLCLYS